MRLCRLGGEGLEHKSKEGKQKKKCVQSYRLKQHWEHQYEEQCGVEGLGVGGLFVLHS